MKRKGRACALDLGRARVGVAVLDELGMFAHARGTISGRDEKALVEEVAQLVVDEQIETIVIGLPLHMNGEERRNAGDVRRVAQKIADRTKRNVELWDERWTTKQALGELRASELSAKQAKGKVDTVSAVLILEGWLASQGHPEQSPPIQGAPKMPRSGSRKP